MFTTQSGGQRMDSVPLNLPAVVIRAITEREQKITGLLRFSIPLPPLLLWCHSSIFCLFLLKGPNSQVAQIPHCTGLREKNKKTFREKSNLIQLKATIIWMSQSAVRFGFFFYVNAGEGESEQRRRRGGGGFPFWNTAPPVESLRSWERRKERWKTKTWRGGQTWAWIGTNPPSKSTRLANPSLWRSPLTYIRAHHFPFPGADVKQTSTQ